MILAVRPFEIGAPGTPGVSHGTEIFDSNFFPYHPKMILFYVFYWLVRLKMPKNWNTWQTSAYFSINTRFGENDQFSSIWVFLAIPINKTHKIRSFQDGMTKILSQKFRSHGTPLGYLGPLFHRDVRLGACWLQILFIWGPYDPPGLVAPQVNAKILKTLGSWCGLWMILKIDKFPSSFSAVSSEKKPWEQTVDYYL